MRKPIISRTMKVTFVKAKCYDVESDEAFEYEDEIPRTYKDEKVLLKAVKSYVETDRVKVLKILETEARSHLYAMTERTFMNNATEITGRSAAETAALFGTTEDELEVESADDEQ